MPVELPEDASPELPPEDDESPPELLDVEASVVLDVEASVVLPDVETAVVLPDVVTSVVLPLVLEASVVAGPVEPVVGSVVVGLVVVGLVVALLVEPVEPVEPDVSVVTFTPSSLHAVASDIPKAKRQSNCVLCMGGVSPGPVQMPSTPDCGHDVRFMCYFAR